MQVTYKKIKDMFYESVRDREDVQALFQADQVAFWCNKALAELAESVEYIDEEIDTTTVSGTGTYELADDQMRINRVEVDEKKLFPTTTQKLETMDPRWAQRTGTATRYYTDTIQGADGTLNIGLWSTPSSALDIKVCVYGMANVVSDAEETECLQVPSWFAYNILFSMLSDAYMAETNIQNFQAAQFYRILFDDAARRLRIRSNSRLPKDWAYETGTQKPGRAIDRMPLHIPSP